MGLEDKRDNKVDTKRNGRPINLSLGDDDLFIDLPQAIPGEEKASEDQKEDDIESLLGDIKATNQEIEDLLKSVGIDDLSKLNLEDFKK